jgi:glycerol-3-phosphate O-acyltransferase
VELGDAGVANEQRFIDRCVSLGHEWALRRRIASEESNSAEMFRSALRLAANRDLLDGGADLTLRREQFDDEIRGVRRRLEDIACRAADRQSTS